VTEELVRVRGIGSWTAQMYLLFDLRRPDVWPVLDLGVRAGGPGSWGWTPCSRQRRWKGRPTPTDPGGARWRGTAGGRWTGSRGVPVPVVGVRCQDNGEPGFEPRRDRLQGLGSKEMSMVAYSFGSPERAGCMRWFRPEERPDLVIGVPCPGQDLLDGRKVLFGGEEGIFEPVRARRGRSPGRAPQQDRTEPGSGSRCAAGRSRASSRPRTPLSGGTPSDSPTGVKSAFSKGLLPPGRRRRSRFLALRSSRA
jgi:hypothetical protein